MSAYDPTARLFLFRLGHFEGIMIHRGVPNPQHSNAAIFQHSVEKRVIAKSPDR